MSCSGDCKAPSWPGKAVSFWKGSGLSNGAAHLLGHRHGLFAREKCKLEQNHSHTSLLHPMPHPTVLGVVCPHHGNSWGIRAVSHVVGKEGETGHLYELLFATSFPRSLGCACSFPHIQTHLVGNRRVGGYHFLPLQKGMGAGGGERGTQRKSCVWGKRWH